MSRARIGSAIVRGLARVLPRLRNRHFLLLDILLFSVTPLLALVLRLERQSAMEPYIPALLEYTVFALLVRLISFYLFGIYSYYWRCATVAEMAQLAVAAATALVLIVPAYLLPDSTDHPMFRLPRSMPFIDGLLAFLGASAIRFSVRFFNDMPKELPREDARRVLVMGAGVSGQIIVREMRASPRLGMIPVGFVDDDPEKQNLHLLNIPVFGGRERIPELVEEYDIDEVVIAISNAPGKIVREILRLCDQAGVKAMTVPGMSAILDGRVRVSQLRRVEIEDLLRREPIVTDTAAVSRLIRGRRVLVTGGGGSIGSELCRQVLQFRPAELVILGHGENSVFEITNELRDHLRKSMGTAGDDAPIVRPVIADIRFAPRLRGVIEEARPHILFHAAAHKHVPLMEENPSEAVTNNIFGTKNVLEAALAADVEHFVLISTDKAVKPTSVMGATKRAAEQLVNRAARQSGKPYVSVRFGNVLGSRGSVVPIFRRQIAAGGPVTVSHPEMTRYFMTIPEAVQLVLQATVLGRGGEVLMLDMGDPVRIQDLARDLIELSGLEVGRDIDIVYTGIRPGEKLYEELLIPGEVYEKTPHEKILLVQSASGAAPVDLDEMLRALGEAVKVDERAAIVERLCAMVPEFEPDEVRRDSHQSLVISH
jgi:FlaA1/EpsC-like NDP-sugar epimerase